MALGCFRPLYNCLITLVSPGGIERTINGTDSIRILPRFRQMGESYEPEVWSHMMCNVQSGDKIADVGAYIGLYTIAFAQRVGVDGKVIAFEPDPENFSLLQSHVKLNRLQNRVELVPYLVSLRNDTISFLAGKASQSSMCNVQPCNNTVMIRSIRLDTFFSSGRVDILKVDVEGFEEEVLKSGENLLSDRNRSPRLIYIEVHPYVWHETKTTSDSLLSYLRQCGYQVVDINNQQIDRVSEYGEIIAVKSDFLSSVK